MKRKLSLLMSLLMVLTLIPMSAFAATIENPSSTTALQTWADRLTSETVRANERTGVKELKFGAGGNGISSTGQGLTVVLTLSEGDKFEEVEITTDQGTVALHGTDAAVRRTNLRNAGIDVTNNNGFMQIVINPLLSNGNPSNITLESVSFRAKLANDATGFRMLFVDEPVGYGGRNQQFVVAQVSGTARGSINRLESVKKFNPSNTWRTMTGARFNVVNPEVYRETQFVTTDRDEVTFRLPSDFNWVVEGSTRTRAFVDGVEVDVRTRENGRVLLVRHGSTTGLVTVEIIPVFSTTRDARLGQEVTVFVDSAEVTGEVIIAEFNDFTQGIKVEDVRELVAGRVSETRDQRVKITIEDNSFGFASLRDVDLTFENGTAKLIRATGVDSVKVDGFRQGTRVPVGVEDQWIIDGNDVVADRLNAQYADTFQFVTTRNASNEVTNVEKIELEFFLRADNNAGGKDMTVNVSGRNIDYKDVKVASVVAPVEIAVSEVKNIELGLQAQEAGDIIITETVAGALRRGEEYRIALNDTDSESATGRIKMLDGYKLEVAEGNGLNVRHSIQNNELVFTVLRESINEPAKITISNIRLTTDRTVAYGDIKAELVPANRPGFMTYNLAAFSGSRYEFNQGRFVNIDRAKTIFASANYMKLATEAPTTVRPTTVFTIGSTSYTVGGEARTLDAAPYISNGRTMLPIGTIAQLVGATVNYDSVTRTAVFQNDRTTVSMNLDTNILMVNGSPVPMDTKPEIQQSRAFVSLVYVAQAFGIQNGTDIVYNATDRTVTMFPGVQ